MRPVSFLLLILAMTMAMPGRAEKWQATPKDVWDMKNNPELVAQGAVVLERKLDFQPFYFEQTLRVRILSQAGVAAAEIPDMPPLVLFLDGQVTFPDGRVQAITKREDFLVRKVVSGTEGTINEGVLIPSGITSDCVMELRWREATARGRANQLRTALRDLGNLPERCGDFWFWTLASAYPTRTCIIQMGKDVAWPMMLLGTQGVAMEQGANSMGSTFTFHNLPGLPAVPYSSEINRPSPKVVIYRPIETMRYLQSDVPVGTYWQKAVDFYYKTWFQKFVTKSEGYKAFSSELRKDLTGGPRDKAKVIAERVAKRTINLDHLLFDEKPPLGARREQELAGVSNLEYVAKAGYADTAAMVKLLFHILIDEGLQPKVALVANKNRWNVNPEVRTPFQFTHTLLGVDEPGQPTLWLDPASRLVPAGQVQAIYQGTRAVIIDSGTWQARFQEIRFARAEDNTRSFTFRMEVLDDQLKVHVGASLLGAAALPVRILVGDQAPTQRANWFKERLETKGLTVSTVAITGDLDLTKPLNFTAEGTLPLEAGRLLKLNPFPGMDSGLYMPASLPEQRRDPIHMPYRSLQEASSTIHVPKGYRLRAPIRVSQGNRWGDVNLAVEQDPGSGDLKATLKIQITGTYDGPGGYGSLKDFLQWVRAATQPEITLEKSGESES